MIERQIAAGAVLFVATVFLLIAALGIVRSKNNFAALHCAGMANVLAPLLVFVAVVLATGFGQSAIKMFVLLAVLWAGAPILSHALGVAERRRKPR